MRPQRQIESFRDAVNAHGFQDLNFSGSKFTWCNMQEDSNRIHLRLDRAFANLEWTNYFKNLRVHHLAESTSDHCLLRISDSCSLPTTRKRRFHFEAMWAKKEDCKEIIEAAWPRGTSLNTPEGIVSNLKRCASYLMAWNKDVLATKENPGKEKRSQQPHCQGPRGLSQSRN